MQQHSEEPALIVFPQSEMTAHRHGRRRGGLKIECMNNVLPDHRAAVRLCDGHGLGESSCTVVLGFVSLLQLISAGLGTQFTLLTAFFKFKIACSMGAITRSALSADKHAPILFIFQRAWTSVKT